MANGDVTVTVRAEGLCTTYNFPASDIQVVHELGVVAVLLRPDFSEGFTVSECREGRCPDGAAHNQ